MTVTSKTYPVQIEWIVPIIPERHDPKLPQPYRPEPKPVRGIYGDVWLVITETETDSPPGVPMYVLTAVRMRRCGRGWTRDGGLSLSDTATSVCASKKVAPLLVARLMADASEAA